MLSIATFLKQVRALSLPALTASLAIPGIVMAQTAPCASDYMPPGAQSLGFTQRVFCVVPTVADITTENESSFKLFSGQWYSANPTPLTFYAMSGSTLVIHSGGGVTTEMRNSQLGALPTLLASNGFYVEFQVSLSSNDPDHFPALFAMPQEHNGHKTDHVPGDPTNFERWMELDVDEGGYSSSPLGGFHGTLINWSGTYPTFQHQNWSVDPPSTFGMDRTQYHIFGLSYDPKAQRVTWWMDGVNVGSQSSQPIPSIVNTYHYYLIMGAQMHKLNKPYDMYVKYFGAWSGAAVPRPPSDLKMTPQ